MHAKCDRQFDIGGTAGTRDEDQIMMVFGFGKDLVHIGAQHFGADDCQMDARQQGNARGLFGRGSQDERPCFGKEIIGFGDPQITECHFMFAGIGGDELHAERVRGFP